jgi:multidrug efflux pump subunit AcrA (membrane-fusion protein)
MAVEKPRVRRLRKNPRVIAPLALAALALLAGCSGGKEAPPVVAVQAATVRQAPIAQVITAQALLFPLQEAALTPKVSAPVEKFYVQRGQRVHRGQLLVTLQNRDLKAAEVENQGAYQQAQAEYQQAMALGVPQQAQKAQVELQTAKQELDAQQKIFDARQNLYRQGAIPRKELDDARIALTQARGNYQIALKQWQNLQHGGTQQAIQSAKGQLAAAQGKYLAAQADVAYSEIRSPIEGVVTDRLNYPGQVAAADSPVVTVMDLSQIIAKAHIPAAQAAALKSGDPATITVEGGQPLQGKVTVVSPALDPNSTTVEVWVQAANPGGELKPGSSATVQMTAQTVPNALIVPSSALLTDEEGKTTVMVVGADQTASSRDVQTGVRQGDEVQITSGLKPGEVVVTSGNYGLPAHTKVTVQTSNAGVKEASPPQEKSEE